MSHMLLKHDSFESTTFFMWSVKAACVCPSFGPHPTKNRQFGGRGGGILAWLVLLRPPLVVLLLLGLLLLLPAFEGCKEDRTS